MDQLLSNIGNDTSIPPLTLILIGMKIMITELKAVNESVSKVDDLGNYKKDNEILKLKTKSFARR